MNCAETESLIHAYFDDELDVMVSLQVEEHVQTCPQCAADLRAHKALRAALRDPSMRHPIPGDLTRQIRAAIGADAVPLRWRPLSGRAAGIAAAALFLLAVGAFVLFSKSMAPRADSVAAEVLSSHLRSLMVGPQHLMDIASTDRHTVKPWFDGRIDFAPVVADFKPEGFPLDGGRIDYVDNRAVASLVYRARNHVINLMQWPSIGSRGLSQTQLSRQGYNLIHWTQGRMEFWAISDLNPAELEGFCRLVQARTPPSAG